MHAHSSHISRNPSLKTISDYQMGTCFPLRGFIVSSYTYRKHTSGLSGLKENCAQRRICRRFVYPVRTLGSVAYNEPLTCHAVQRMLVPRWSLLFGYNRRSIFRVSIFGVLFVCLILHSYLPMPSIRILAMTNTKPLTSSIFLIHNITLWNNSALNIFLSH